MREEIEKMEKNGRKRWRSEVERSEQKMEEDRLGGKRERDGRNGGWGRIRVWREHEQVEVTLMTHGRQVVWWWWW